MNKPDLPSYPSVTPNTPLEPFRAWVQMALPTVYDDSLSYYELLSKVVAYLNTTNEHLTNVDNNFATINASLSDLWAQIQTWFNDLDVTEEINTKVQNILDIWASPYNPDVPQSGTIHSMFLPDIVAEAQGTTDSWLRDNIHTETGYVLDSSLSLDNAAAPASLVGSSIENMGNVCYSSSSSYYASVANAYLGVNGSSVSSAGYSLMYSFIPLNKAYKKLIVYIKYPENMDVSYHIRYAIKKNKTFTQSSDVILFRRVPSGTGNLSTVQPIIIDYSDYIADNETLYLQISITDSNANHEWSTITNKDTLTFRYDESLIDQIFADKLRSPALLSNTYNIIEYFGLTKYLGWSQMISAIGASGTFVDMADNSIVVGTTENVTAFVNTEHHTFPFTLSSDHRQALIKIKGGNVGRAVYFYLIMDDDAGQPIYIGRQIHDNTYDEDYIGAWSLFSASPVKNVSTDERAVESKYVGAKIIEYSDRLYKYVYNKFTFTDEHWLYPNGVPYGSGSTKSTDYIKINPDEDVYFTGLPITAYPSALLNCAGCIYDIDKNVIGYIDVTQLEEYTYPLPRASNAGESAITYIPMYKYHLPVGAEYVRLNIYHTTITSPQYYTNSYLSCMSNCACYLGEQLSNIVVYKNNAPHKDVKIAFVGPSSVVIDKAYRYVTANEYSGLYYQYNSSSARLSHYVTGFQEYFVPYCDRVDSYGYSGYPIYNLPPSDADYSLYPVGFASKFVDLITANPTYISDIDILVIMGDRNYISYGRINLLGNADDGLTSDNYDTYCGALNTLIRHVYALNSNIQIFVGNNGYGYDYYTETDSELKEKKKIAIDTSNEKINECLSYWRLPLIDSKNISQLNGYTMGNSNNPNITTPLLTYDLTHPNTWGNKIIGEAMRKQIFGY